MKKLPLFLFIALVAFAVYAMIFWKDGNITIPLKNKSEKSETKRSGVHDFTKIEVDGVFHVDVKYGKEEKIEIEAPSYIKKRIKTKVKSKTLYFELDKGGNLNAAGKVKVHITTVKLNDFSISGASSITLNNTLKDNEFILNSSGASSFSGKVNVETVEIESNGAAKINLEGSSRSASIVLSGASKVKDYDFEVDSLTVDLSGASSAKITCSKSINGDVSGASSLSYDGDAKVSGISASGAASLIKR